jgi:poly-gamma-glutamate capsule biosynthesis protein CapA/YwtB (metallophosphatase superfamily)
VPTARRLSIALTGNVYFEQPILQHSDPGFHEAAGILRDATLAIANFECALGADGLWPAFGGGMGWSGTHMNAPLSMLADLRFLGVDGLFCANNHTADFAEAGLLTTIRHLREAALPFAGIGASLAEATEAAYLDTPHGRVAFIGAADWGPRRLMELPFPWPAGYLGSDERPPFRSRPGVNLVRYDAVVHVDDAAFDQLRRISASLDWDKAKIVRRMGGGRTEALVGPSPIGWETDTADAFFFMGRKFVRDHDFRISTLAYREDLDRNFEAIRRARERADLVIVGLHDQSHAAGILDFVRTFARGAIDAGADLYVSHGGKGRGIELYRGRPILYGQTSFWLQSEESAHIPLEMVRRMGLPDSASAADYVDARRRNEARAKAAGGRSPHSPTDQKFIQVVEFDDGLRAREIRIHPIEMRADPVDPRRRYPVLIRPGDPASAPALEDAVRRSAPLGTAVVARDGVAIVQVADE